MYTPRWPQQSSRHPSGKDLDAKAEQVLANASFGLDRGREDSGRGEREKGNGDEEGSNDPHQV
jgi:hypothetical protein